MDAEDLTQSYFARFFEKGYVHDFRPEKGRFRTFLLASVSHFLANEWDREKARKRGGGKGPGISLDTATAEERLSLEPADHLTPEEIFERQWAAAVLARCLERLRDEQEEAGGGGDRFERMKPYLCGDGAGSGYETLAGELSVERVGGAGRRPPAAAAVLRRAAGGGAPHREAPGGGGRRDPVDARDRAPRGMRLGERR